MSRRITLEEAKNEIYGLSGNEYTIVGNYVSSDIPFNVRHNECGLIYHVRLPAFIKGQRCPKCSRARANVKRIMSQDKAETKMVKAVGTEFTLISPYKVSRIKVIIKHNTCGRYFKMQFSKFLGRGTCPRCGRDNTRKSKIKSTKWFKGKVQELLGDEYEVHGEYKLATTPILMYHRVCGKEYMKTPRIIIDQQVRCPYCSVVSVGEKLVRRYLQDSGIKYQSQKYFDDLRDTRPLSYDFYIPSQDILIEYQGKQHYEARDFFGKDYFETQVRHDSLKREYARRHNYRLIEIPYTNRTYSEIKEILDSILLLP